MIIVSQDKKLIINFNVVQKIRIERYTPFQREGYTHKILGENLDGCVTEMGTYATEERAKEVLKAITNTFSASNLNGKLNEMDLILKAKLMARFEMPEE